MSETQRAVWRYPTITAGGLIGPALRAVFHAAERLWAVWLVWAVLQGLLVMVVRQMVGDRPALSVGETAIGLLVATPLFAIPAAITARTLLGQEATRWRPDKGFGAYVLITLGMATLELPVSVVVNAVAAGGASLETVSQIGFAVGAAWWLLTLWPTARLALWSISRLAGHPRATAPASWAAMKGAVWPWVLAYVMLSAGPFVATEAAYTAYYFNRDFASLALCALVSVLWGVVIISLQVALYQQRMAAAQPVSDVFD